MITELVQTQKISSIYEPKKAQIIDVQSLTVLEKLFTVGLMDGSALNHTPGQFVQVSIMGIGEAPISISSSPSQSENSFELCIRKAGKFTAAMHRLGRGDEIGVRGPYGNGVPIGRFHGKDIIFAPGGLGLAPLRSSINQVLAERSQYGRVIILYGAKHPSEILFRDELELWAMREDVELLTTVDRADHAWKGNVGVITTLFPKIQVNAPNTVAVIVGPPVMYRFVLVELLALGIYEGNIWLSLERRMKCGTGKCGHCQINNLYTCMDGPCFNYAQIKHKEEAL